ncbi:cytidylyltransferase domain-containing protein [Tepidibacter sp. Z1-5]|uniref:cytidylyltransferase domain-containing protein n=1 Tax=Tepidibacter sp. Z1-5 TaxID=3134138 RepID=UPI0030BB2F85
MKTGVIIQARMGSTRLRGKVLMKINKKTVLNHVIDRVKKCKYIDDIIVATTKLKKDDTIINELNNLKVKYFRGSEENVLSRYYEAAKYYNLDPIIRITADCPLIDPNIIDDIIRFYIENDYELVTNAPNDLSQRTYPRGLDVEIFSFKMLEEAHLKTTKDYEKEHVTPYMYENNKKIYVYKNDVDYSKYRLTLDTKEDYMFIQCVYENLYENNKFFSMKEIIDFLKGNQDIVNINKDIKQKNIK